MDKLIPALLFSKRSGKMGLSIAQKNGPTTTSKATYRLIDRLTAQLHSDEDTQAMNVPSNTRSQDCTRDALVVGNAIRVRYFSMGNYVAELQLDG